MLQPVAVLYQMLYEQEKKPHVSQKAYINLEQFKLFFTAPQNPHSTKLQAPG